MPEPDEQAPRRPVSRRALLAGLGGGAALTAATGLTAAPADATTDPFADAQTVSNGLGKQQPPRWRIERSIPCRTPGHAQWVAEPGLDAGSLWLGDSTFEFNRTPFQYAKALAARNPGLRIIYDKAGWGGGVDGAYPPMSTFAPFKPGDGTGAYSQIFNADSWAAAGGTDQHQPIPGIKNYSLVLPATARYTPWGANTKGSSLTRGAVGVDIKPASWRSNTISTLLTQDSPAGRGTVLRLNNGYVELRLAMDAAGSRIIAATSTVPLLAAAGVGDSDRCAVLVEFDLDRSGRSVFTPYYRVGGQGQRWQPLGSPVTMRQTGAWRGTPNVPWEVGGGGTFRGEFYEAFVRKVDRTGPDMVPRLPHQWTTSNVNMRGTLQGGRTYWMTVMSWPQHGLVDFAARTDLGPVLKLFKQAWNKDTPSKANVVSPLDMVPQLPYLMTVLNSGHNETSTGAMNTELLRSVVDKLVARAPDAEHCVLVQNATLRTDTSTATRDDGSFVFDQTNTTGNRRSHDWRISQYAAFTRTLGCQVLDARSDMVDYVRNGGSLSDLVQAGGEQLHPNAAGSLLIALALLNQTTTTDFGTTGVLP